MPKLWPTRRSSRRLVVLLAAPALVVAACDSGAREARGPAARPAVTTTTTVPAAIPPDTSPATTPPPADTPVLVAAGDIACAPGQPARPGQCQMEATAQLVESLQPTVVAPLGDLQYERGEASGFAGSYDPTWGRFKAITRPAPGNHEYAGGRAGGYFGYFGAAAAGVDGRGWYSYDLGGWHVVVLNSVCSAVGGCGEGSQQLAWLRDDLRSNTTARCVLAYWHHARHSSGLHGGDPGYEPFWEALSQGGADVVLSGHDHHYERFAPIAGIRQFVVGTGGRNLYPVAAPLPGSEVHNTTTFGVLALTLRNDGYDWRFVPVPGSSFEDRGSGGCG